MKRTCPILLFIIGFGFGCTLKTGGSLWLTDDVVHEQEPDGDDTTMDGPDGVDDPDGLDMEEGAGDPLMDPDLIDPADEDTVTDMEVEDGPVCDPSTSWCDDDGNLATCNGEGTGFDTEPCRLGCHNAPSPHCLALVPSNVADDSLLCLAGTADFAPASGIRYVHVDTDTGVIRSWDSEWTYLGELRAEGEGLISGINFAIVDQTSGGPRLGVFSVDSMTLHADIYLYATGSNAMAFFSCNDVVVAGVFQAGADVYSGSGYLPGPGGSGSGEGDGRGGPGISAASNVSGGGGGGGFGGAGGSGNGASSSGGAAGEAYGNDALVPLLGGSGGGSGADNSSGYGAGGPGGGALQVSTPASITVLANGVIESNGEKGLGGHRDGGGGGGGGSGGGVLLEALAITVEAGGLVTANGGGGGSGGYYSSTWGNNGQRGLWSLVAAAGGASPTSGACAGASGNSASSMDGATVSCSDTNGGGGGGGAGRIRLNAGTHALADDTLSPSLSASPTTTTTGPLDLR